MISVVYILDNEDVQKILKDHSIVKLSIEHMKAAEYIDQLYGIKTLYGVALYFYNNRGYKRRSHFGLLLYVKENHIVVRFSL